jgi:RecA/RadA recombinase
MMPSTSESFLNSKAKQVFEIGSTDQPESLLLSFGSKLDGLCGGVHVRQLAVLYGEKVCQTIAQQLCVRAQLPIKAAGLNARSVFIDGGNTFDPHYVSNYAATLPLNRDKILRGITISRAFTCYH